MKAATIASTDWPTSSASAKRSFCAFGDTNDAAMTTRHSSIFLKRLVRVQGRKVVARFLREPGRAAVITFPTHSDARRAAARLIVQYRLAGSDEAWDEQLLFRTELIRAYNSLDEAPDDDES